MDHREIRIQTLSYTLELISLENWWFWAINRYACQRITYQDVWL